MLPFAHFVKEPTVFWDQKTQDFAKDLLCFFYLKTSLRNKRHRKSFTMLTLQRIYCVFDKKRLSLWNKDKILAMLTLQRISLFFGKTHFFCRTKNTVNTLQIQYCAVWKPFISRPYLAVHRRSLQRRRCIRVDRRINP